MDRQAAPCQARLRYNSLMKQSIGLVSRFYRARSRFYQRQRLLFPSPAEVRFIRLMGGRVVTVPFMKHPKTGFAMAKIVTLGKILNTEGFIREVRVGSKYVDFGNDLRRGIEIDGRKYHTDIVEQQQRDEYFWGYDWQVLHIDATELYRNPSKVQRAAMAFITY